MKVSGSRIKIVSIVVTAMMFIFILSYMRSAERFIRLDPRFDTKIEGNLDQVIGDVVYRSNNGEIFNERKDVVNKVNLATSNIYTKYHRICVNGRMFGTLNEQERIQVERCTRNAVNIELNGITLEKFVIKYGKW